MPNWCTNAVTISHEDVTKIDAIETALKTEEKNFFQAIRPMPTSEEENWYSWNVNNWGTKWDASVYDWERQDENTITINFDTAWSPPTILYEFMEEEEGYNVDAYYHEGGMSFCGKFQDGYDSYYEYDITDRQSIEDLPEDVVDFADLMTAHEDWVAENEEEEWDPAEELEKIEVSKDVK